MAGVHFFVRSCRKVEEIETGNMLYKSCGLLGFGSKPLTEADFKASNYSLAGVSSACGTLGLFPTAATFADLPSSMRDCTPSDYSGEAVFTLSDTGECVASCAAGTVRAPDTSQCVTPGDSCTGDASEYRYVRAADGSCTRASCPAGKISLARYGAGDLGSTECPIGYKPIADRATCAAAVSHLPSHFVDHTDFTDSNFAHTQPPGCFVFPADGRLDGKPAATSIMFNESSKGAPNKNAFLICERADPKPCSASVGEGCLTKSYPNYTWRNDGKCVGTCSLFRHCKGNERCCAGSCYADDALVEGRCPNYEKEQHTIEKVGGVIQTVGEKVLKTAEASGALAAV